MIRLPEIIDAVDIFTKSDADGIDKIASALETSAAIPFENDIITLPLEKFACVIKYGEKLLKKFPVHTKESTELNIQALLYTQDTLPTEVVSTASNNLLKAAENWGVTKGVDELKNITSPTKGNFVNFDKINIKQFQEKTAEIPTAEFKVFALNAKYPIDTPELLKQAENYFKQYSDRLDSMEQYKYATNLNKQAKKLRVQIRNPQILKYANLRFERNPNLKTLLSIRDKQAHTDGAFKKVAMLSSSAPLEKIAEAIYDLDKEFGLDKLYSRGLPDPIFTVFNSLEKKATEINGKQIRLEDLRAVPKDSLKSLALTEDTITSLYGDEGIEVLQSLPDPIKDSIIDLL